jgi:hypothetical protein
MKLGLLYLTFENPIHKHALEVNGYINNPNCDIIIHPKHPDSLDAFWKPYCSKYLIETSWGSETIVVASLLLLEQSLQNNCDWFILCSADSYPLISFDDLMSDLDKQPYSMFNPMKDKQNPFKTSQWWALKRDDVIMLLEGILHSSKRMTSSKKSDDLSPTQYLVDLYSKDLFLQTIEQMPKKSAADEHFFLTAFKKLNSAYEYTIKEVHYVKWIEQWVSKHPTIFNRLLPNDIEHIGQSNPYFIRKTFNTFTTEPINVKPTAVLVTIGSENIDKINDYSVFLNTIKGSYDLYLLVMIDDIFKINSELKNTCVQLYSVVWNMVDKAYNSIKEVLPYYSSIVIIKEMDNANTFDLNKPIINSTRRENTNQRYDNPRDDTRYDKRYDNRQYDNRQRYDTRYDNNQRYDNRQYDNNQRYDNRHYDNPRYNNRQYDNDDTRYDNRNTYDRKKPCGGQKSKRRTRKNKRLTKKKRQYHKKTKNM